MCPIEKMISIKKFFTALALFEILFLISVVSAWPLTNSELSILRSKIEEIRKTDPLLSDQMQKELDISLIKGEVQDGDSHQIVKNSTTDVPVGSSAENSHNVQDKGGDHNSDSLPESDHGAGMSTSHEIEKVSDTIHDNEKGNNPGHDVEHVVGHEVVDHVSPKADKDNHGHQKD